MIANLLLLLLVLNTPVLLAEEISLPDNAFQEALTKTEGAIQSNDDQNAEYRVFKKPNRIVMKAAVENFKSKKAP